MRDKQQVEKIQQMQEKILSQLEQLNETEELPADVCKAMENASKWDEQISDAAKDDIDARRWEPHKLAHALHKHISYFPYNLKQEIQEYCYAVDKLPYEADRTLGV